MSKLSFVIFASGKGTNACALMEQAKKHSEQMEAVALISDRTGIPALELAEAHHVPSKVIPGKNEEELLRYLKELKPTWAFLAGYKKILSASVLEYFRAPEGYYRVLNVHPSLLPAYPGLHGYERAYQDGVKITGVTVHLVDTGLDTGPIVLQEAFFREERDSLEALMEKAQKIEHKLFVRALDLAASGKIHLGQNPRWVSVGERA